MSKKDLLFGSVSIADWILPAVSMGHLGRVVWVKPPWANQIPDGSYHLCVGKDRIGGHLRYVWEESASSLASLVIFYLIRHPPTFSTLIIQYSTFPYYKHYLHFSLYIIPQSLLVLPPSPLVNYPNLPSPFTIVCLLPPSPLYNPECRVPSPTSSVNSFL